MADDGQVSGSGRRIARPLSGRAGYALLLSLGRTRALHRHQGVTEQNAVDDADEPQQRVSPSLKRALMEVLAVEAQ